MNHLITFGPVAPPDHPACYIDRSLTHIRNITGKRREIEFFCESFVSPAGPAARISFARSAVYLLLRESFVSKKFSLEAFSGYYCHEVRCCDYQNGGRDDFLSAVSLWFMGDRYDDYIT